MKYCKHCGGLGGAHKTRCTYVEKTTKALALLDSVIDNNEEFFINKDGKPAAVILPWDRYQELKNASADESAEA